MSDWEHQEGRAEWIMGNPEAWWRNQREAKLTNTIGARSANGFLLCR